MKLNCLLCLFDVFFFPSKTFSLGSNTGSSIFSPSHSLFGFFSPSLPLGSWRMQSSMQGGMQARKGPCSLVHRTLDMNEGDLSSNPMYSHIKNKEWHSKTSSANVASCISPGHGPVQSALMLAPFLFLWTCRGGDLVWDPWMPRPLSGGLYLRRRGGQGDSLHQFCLSFFHRLLHCLLFRGKRSKPLERAWQPGNAHYGLLTSCEISLFLQEGSWCPSTMSDINGRRHLPARRSGDSGHEPGHSFKQPKKLFWEM